MTDTTPTTHALDPREGAPPHPTYTPGRKPRVSLDPAKVTCPLCRNTIARRPDLFPPVNRPDLTPEPNRPETVL